jgi:hypothetical protein
MAQKKKQPRGLSRLRAKKDPAYFADKLLNFKMHQYQKAVLTDNHDTVVWAAGRGCGKTYTLMAGALWKCWTTPGFRIIYTAARFGQAKIAWDVAMSMLSGTPLMDDIVVLSAEKIELNNSSTIHFTPGGSHIALRGFHARYNRDGYGPGVWMVVDEASFVHRDTFVAASSILVTAPKGKRRMFVTGSPQGMNSFFYAEYMAGVDPTEKYTSAHTTSAEGCPHIDADYLQQEKQKLSPAEYAAEIRAEFQEALGSFFAEYVDPAIDQYELPWEPNEDDSRWEYHLGVDLSGSTRVGSDFCCLVVAARRWPEWGKEDEDSGEIRICEIVHSQHLNHESLKREVMRLERKYNIYDGTAETYQGAQFEAFARVYVDGRWRSRGTEECEVKFNLIHPTNETKHESLGNFHHVLRDGILKLPCGGENAKTLLKEMKTFSYSTTDTGLIRYAAMDGCHDDVVMACTYALEGLRHKDGYRGSWGVC